MNWKVIVASEARKSLARFPAKDQAKVAIALLEMSENPFSGDVVKLEGEPRRWRRRVGSYRVFFSLEKASRLVSVSAIVRRTSTTY